VVAGSFGGGIPRGERFRGAVGTSAPPAGVTQKAPVPGALGPPRYGLGPLGDVVPSHLARPGWAAGARSCAKVASRSGKGWQKASLRRHRRQLNVFEADSDDPSTTNSKVQPPVPALRVLVGRSRRPGGALASRSATGGGLSARSRGLPECEHFHSVCPTSTGNQPVRDDSRLRPGAEPVVFAGPVGHQVTARPPGGTRSPSGGDFDPLIREPSTETLR